MKKNLILFMLLFCLTCLFACSNKEDSSLYKVKNYEVEAKYDFTYKHRGYYELIDVEDYYVQNTVSQANIDGFGIIQTYQEYLDFTAKITNSNFKYSENFFIDKSLIYISNKANDVLELEGKRYSPYNINNCEYVNDVCYIALDYAYDFYTYYFEIGVETSSIYTFAFKDSEKKTFDIQTYTQRDPIAYMGKVYASNAIRIEGERKMVIDTIYNNSFEAIPDNIYQLGKVLNNPYQGFCLRNAVYEGGFSEEKLVELSGTSLRSYYDYKTFFAYFDVIDCNFNYNRDFFDKYSLAVYITNDNNYIFDDSGFTFSYLSIDGIDYSDSNVTISLKENGKNYLGDCVNVFLIAYERDNSKSLTIEIIK